MSDEIDLRMRLKQSLGIDRKFFFLCFWTAFTTAVAYAVWTLGTNQSLAEALRRFPLTLFVALEIVILFSPLVVPCMLIGWSVAWVLGRLFRLPLRARILIAAGILGASAVLPFFYFFGRIGYAAENEWRLAIRPLLLLTPTAAILVSQIVYRRR